MSQGGLVEIRLRPGLVALLATTVLLPVLALALVIALVPDSADARDAVQPDATSRPTSPPPGTDEVAEADYPDTWDTPDDRPQTSDQVLSAVEVTELLQTSASDSTNRACSPDDVDLSLRVVDGAAGTVFGYLVAEATVRCTLVGWPGLGARGEWGDPLPMQIDPEARGWDGSALDGTPVSLSRGRCAVVALRWTGERAGAMSQAMSSAVVQLTADSPATLVPNAVRGEADWVDWTIATHLYPQPWQPDPGLC